jgi:hypothetical protein
MVQSKWQLLRKLQYHQTVNGLMRLGITDRWRTCHRWSGWLQAVATLAVPIIAWAGKCTIPKGSTGLWYDVLSIIHDHYVALLLFATLCLWASQLVRTRYGDPWICETVKSLLEEMRADIFEGQIVSAHSDRVTLFKKKNWRMRFCCWPVRDWLCSVERSDHMTRRKRKWLRVQDNANEWECVGGTTWGMGRTILKDNLPLIKKGASGDQIVQYANETFVSFDYVEKQIAKKATLPQSLCGIMVEVNHKPWGVIVIDSALPNLPQKDKIEMFFKKHANVLGKLLAKL